MAAHIDYYVSLNSPWTCLGATRLEQIAERHGATVTIWPVDFGTIFAGSGGLPLPKRSPQRQAYRMQELRRWRDFLGIPIALKPAHFPAAEGPAAHSVIALRETQGNAAALRLAHRILKALWVDELNTGDPAVLAGLMTECGVDAEALLTLAAEPRWAEMRAADSQAALARGVFGAPSFVVGEEIFWGQDRLDFLDRHLLKG